MTHSYPEDMTRGRFVPYRFALFFFRITLWQVKPPSKQARLQV
jgi:hypothetical protein